MTILMKQKRADAVALVRQLRQKEREHEEWRSKSDSQLDASQNIFFDAANAIEFLDDWLRQYEKARQVGRFPIWLD